MAIDFLVGLLLLCSASVNLLALGAFWVTPSLRNGLANRFVVNLLLVNLVCCLVLAPSLLLNTLSFTSEISPTPNTFEQPPSSFSTIQQNASDELAPTNEVQSEYINDKIAFTEFRSWGLDFVVAAATFSVLLVVGDTWCAVTDPLRYHTRLSDKKAWIFVAAAWVIGIIFGVASAFRSEHVLTETDAVYNTIYSYAYFLCAIMAPFFLVCAMYWRIFSEARESGQRMRQNGSSPLLQSALNLAQVSAATAHQHVDRCGGLTMKIDAGTKVVSSNNNVDDTSLIIDDSNTNCNNNTTKDDDNNNDKESTQPLLRANNLTLNNNHNNPFIDYKSPEKEIQSPMKPQQQLQENLKQNLQKEKLTLSLDNNSLKKHSGAAVGDINIGSGHKILLTLTTSSSSEQIRRNVSAKQFLIENMDDKHNIRHASSTPNLNKLDRYELHPPMVLPLPTVHVPPKALNYMASIRHRLSNASSLFKYREESRAARISILVVIMFLVSYLPYGILVLMQGHNDLLEASNQSLLAIFAVVLANLSSPFIFAYRNKRVRRGVLRLLGVEKQAAERLQKFQNSTIKRKTTTFINLNRSTSRASTYSGSSCKYLTVTPHNTAVTINGSYIVEIDKLSPCFEESLSSPGATVAVAYAKQVPEVHGHVNGVNNGTSGSDGEVGGDECNKMIKKSILKRVCDTSKMWGCNCASDVERSVGAKVLPTPV